MNRTPLLPKQIAWVAKQLPPLSEDKRPVTLTMTRDHWDLRWAPQGDEVPISLGVVTFALVQVEDGDGKGRLVWSYEGAVQLGSEGAAAPPSEIADHIRQLACATAVALVGEVRNNVVEVRALFEPPTTDRGWEAGVLRQRG